MKLEGGHFGGDMEGFRGGKWGICGCDHISLYTCMKLSRKKLESTTYPI